MLTSFTDVVRRVLVKGKGYRLVGALAVSMGRHPAHDYWARTLPPRVRGILPP